MADIAELGIKVDTKQVADASKKLAEFGKVAAVAGAATVVALGAIVKKQMEVIDQTSKMAKAIDTTYASLANLKRAGELGGVGLEQINMAAKMLTINIGQAVAGSEAQAKAFKRLGLDAKELSKIPVDERILKINRALEQSVGASERAAVAADIYGAKNALLMKELDPETLKEGARQAKLFGQALSDADALMVEMAGDSLSTFESAATGAAQQLTVALSPAIYALGEAFLDAATEAGGLGDKSKTAAGVMVDVFLAVGDVVDGLHRVISITGSDLAVLAIKSQKYAMLLKLPFVEGAKAQREMLEEIKMLNRAIGEGEDDIANKILTPQFSEAARKRIKEAGIELEAAAKKEAERRKSAEEADKQRQTRWEKYLADQKAMEAAGIQNPFGETGTENAADLLMYGMPYSDWLEGMREKVTTTADMERELTEITKEEQQKRRDEELKTHTETLSAYQNLFGALHGLSEAFGEDQSKGARVLFGISQALAVAQAMLSISAAATALNDPAVTTAQRITNAAAIAGAVSSIVGSVKAVKMQGMAHDGIDSVPKTGTWLLEKGERVMTSETSAKLDKRLDGVGGSNYKIINVIDPAMVGDYLSTDAGEEVVLNIMRKNQREFA